MNSFRRWLMLVEVAAKPMAPKRIATLIRGVLGGKLLIHVRVKDGTDFTYGIDPSAGNFLRSTEAWQWAEETHGNGPELTFFADDFSWATSSNFSKLKNSTSMQAIFVRKNPSIVQDVGNGKVKTSSGAIINYDRCAVADYDDPNFKDMPSGVEQGDWFTKESQEVLAVVDLTDLLTALNPTSGT